MDMPKPNRNLALPLHLATSLASLDFLVNNGEAVKLDKHIEKLPSLVNKLKATIIDCVDDQEKCYIYCRRYMEMVDVLYRMHPDFRYIEAMFSHDYNTMKKLFVEIKTILEERYAAVYGKALIESDKSSINKSFITPTISQDLDSDFTPPETDSDSFKYSALKQNRSKPKLGENNIETLFTDEFLKPKDLFQMTKLRNLLLVDVRSPEDFEKSRILAKNCISIPEKLIMPGLSAHTLGKKLSGLAAIMWDKRETYDGIVLMDDHTTKYDYKGSKLQMLRSFIVEWDVNKPYKENPAILSGGMKEYIQWYPSEVTNSTVYLLEHHNAEMDELLDIDTISYPEPGISQGPRNIRKSAVYSAVNMYEQVERDFDNENVNVRSLSEGHLPLGYVQNSDASGAFESISDTALQSDSRTSSDAKVDVTAQFPETNANLSGSKPIVSNSEHSASLDVSEITPKKPRIQSRDEDVRANLLKEARAVKPKIDITAIGPPQDPAVIVEKEKSGAEPLKHHKLPVRPSQDKPIGDTLVPKRNISKASLKCFGQGFTTIRNINNICFMSAILQSLKVLPPIKAMFVTSDEYIKFLRRNPPILSFHFAMVMRELWKGDKQNVRIFNIKDFKSKIAQINPTFNRGRHEDAFEFFMLVFSECSLDCEYVFKTQGIPTDSERAWIAEVGQCSSVWMNMLYFQIKNLRSCIRCKNICLSFEQGNILYLSMRATTCGLQDLIDDYMVDKNINEYACTRCKTIGSLSQKKEVLLIPEVLCMVLKRYDERSNKVDIPINFPKTNLRFGSAYYKLYSVVQHRGATDFGHYFATVLLDDVQDEWYLFNDERVISLGNNPYVRPEIKSDCAGFFYVKQNRSSL